VAPALRARRPAPRGAAQAKGPNLARICGASGCSAIRGELTVSALLAWTGTGFTLLDAPRPAPYYRFSLYDRGQPAWQLVYVPARHRIRIGQLDVYPYGSTLGPYWRSVTAEGRRALARATRGLSPFPAPRAWA
jgi:hypothetical protein